MPVKIIGMIGVTPPINDATVHINTGGISPDYLKSFAQAHERADYDLVLVGYTSQSADGIAVASYAAAHTERLSFLIAHRPGFVAPTLMARKFATFDQLWNGRLAVHIIAGVSDVENMMDGDAMEKPDRYRRAAEYLDVMHRAWAGPGPFDFEGEFYSVRAARADVPPLQQPHPVVYFGGSSEGALVMGAEHCDVFAMFAEPLAVTAERMEDFRARAAKHGRVPRFNLSLRPIIGETEDAAWAKATHILELVQKEMATTGGNWPPTIPPNVSWPWPRRPISMTNAYGCPWRWPMARGVTQPAWWARRNRWPMPAWNITNSAWAVSCCAVLIL